MTKRSGTYTEAADQLVKVIQRKTRKHYSGQEKIRIVLPGLRGEESTQVCAAASVLPRACSTHGHRDSWRLAGPFCG